MAQNLFGGSSGLPQILVSQQLTATTETTVYTCPASSSVRLAAASIANVSTSACTIGVGLIKSGGTADGTHKVVPSSFVLAAGDTLPLSDLVGGHWLGPGDFISLIAGTANAIDVVISGVVFA